MNHSHHDFNEIAKTEAEKKKYPPPFSLRLTYEERAGLDAERGGKSLAAYIRERLFGDDAAPRKRRGKPPTTVLPSNRCSKSVGSGSQKVIDAAL